MIATVAFLKGQDRSSAFAVLLSTDPHSSGAAAAAAFFSLRRSLVCTVAGVTEAPDVHIQCVALSFTNRRQSLLTQSASNSFGTRRRRRPENQRIDIRRVYHSNARWGEYDPARVCILVVDMSNRLAMRSFIAMDCLLRLNAGARLHQFAPRIVTGVTAEQAGTL